MTDSRPAPSGPGNSAAPSGPGNRAAPSGPSNEAAPAGTVGEVFRTFLLLGLTSFGGPIAHLGYFRSAFVERRRWLSDRAYAEVVSLCQFLPGPASSQVGMVIGLHRAGPLGLVAAWLAFTTPSVLLMIGFALGMDVLGVTANAGWLIGLSAAAVAVVAHAVIGMARSLVTGPWTAGIAVAAIGGALLLPTAIGQLAGIVVGAVVGLVWLRRRVTDEPAAEPLTIGVPRTVAIGCLVGFVVLLLGLPVLAAVTGDPTLQRIAGFYRSGALVFGGGHVVLPLLQAETVPGLLDEGRFLSGYAAAQAVPGPLFSFAGFLGASASGTPSGVVGAVIAVLAIFLPGALLVVGALPFWERLRRARAAAGLLAGVNAAVVGLLADALYSPVFTHGVGTDPRAFVLAALALVALSSWRVPAWAVVIGAALVGAVVWR